MDKQHHIEEKEKELFGSLKIDYSRSKEDVWRSMEELIQDESGGAENEHRVSKIISMKWQRMSAAAVILLLFGSTFFARLYTSSYDLDAGAPVSHFLPDGSEVMLNEGTTISFAPYWWRFDRTVKLEGEAFFQVEKGRRFTVTSTKGRTEVLGTSFNIYARGEHYEVYCVTGKVQVTDNAGMEEILLPGEFVGLTDAEPLGTKTGVVAEQVLSWRSGSFIYNTTPLRKVLKDVERHYRISLEVAIEGIDSLHYTGKFTRASTPEEALEIICYSFGLDFEKMDHNRFEVRVH